MSEIEAQLNLIELIQLKQLTLKEDILEDVKGLTESVIMLIIDELEENKDKWLEKWK